MKNNKSERSIKINKPAYSAISLSSSCKLVRDRLWRWMLRKAADALFSCSPLPTWLSPKADISSWLPQVRTVEINFYVTAYPSGPEDNSWIGSRTEVRACHHRCNKVTISRFTWKQTTWHTVRYPCDFVNFSASQDAVQRGSLGTTVRYFPCILSDELTR